VRLARDEAVAKGIVINGLVILSERQMPWNAEHTNPPGGLENYYRENVVGGPGSFVLVAEDFQSFGRAIIKKMIAEIATLARDPEKWAPVFGKDHAQANKLERDGDSKKSHPALKVAPRIVAR
jgi:hypothetical protein